MSGVKVPPAIVAKMDEIRAWERRACEWLGLDIEAAFKVEDNLGTLARPKPDTEHLRLYVSLVADRSMPDEPSRGHFLGWDAHGDGETTTLVAKVALDWPDEQEFMERVGPRPSILSLEQELMVRGLGES